MWANSSYNARQVKDTVAKVPRLRVEIVKRSDDMKGFVVLPRRWVVERTFSWFGRNRRLAKDYEKLAQALATFNALAAIQLGVHPQVRKEVCFKIRALTQKPGRAKRLMANWIAAGGTKRRGCRRGFQ